MKTFLADTNVLIALLWPTHTRHSVVVKWFNRHRSRGWATCPVTQLGFVRVVSNPAFSRDAVTPAEAMSLLAGNTSATDHVFWPDELSFEQAVTFAGNRLVGHQQVTDAYLAALAMHRGGVLATLDEAIIALTEPKSPERKAIELIA